MDCGLPQGPDVGTVLYKGSTILTLVAPGQGLPPLGLFSQCEMGMITGLWRGSNGVIQGELAAPRLSQGSGFLTASSSKPPGVGSRSGQQSRTPETPLRKEV